MTIKRYIYFFLIALLPSIIFAQEEEKKEGSGLSFKSLRPKKKKDSITFTANDYKIISYLRDTTAVDTSLTIDKYYKKQRVVQGYVRQDALLKYGTAV